MVANFTMHTYGVNQATRFVEGFGQIRNFFVGKQKHLIYIIRAQHVLATILYEYHDLFGQNLKQGNECRYILVYYWLRRYSYASRPPVACTQVSLEIENNGSFVIKISSGSLFFVP